MSNRMWPIEGLAIAAAPAAGYWCAYLFELGYCKFFNIPNAYVEVGVSNILVAIGGIGSLLLFSVVYFEMFFGIYRSLPIPLRNPVRRITFSTLILVGFTLVFNWKWQTTIVAYAVVMGPFIVFEFILPVFTERKIKGYLSKLETAQKIDSQYESATDVFAKTVGLKVFLVIFFIGIASFVAFVAGGIDARYKRVFMIPVEDIKLVVLKRNADYYVAAKFDPESKVVSRQFTVVPNKPEPFKFSYEPVGPLVSVGVE